MTCDRRIFAILRPARQGATETPIPAGRLPWLVEGFGVLVSLRVRRGSKGKWPGKALSQLSPTPH